MKNIILLILAVIPIIFLCFYVYNKDNDKEPKSFLLLLFISGILSCVLVMFFSSYMDNLFPFFKIDTDVMNIYELIIYSFIGVSLIEELAKWFFARFIGFKSINFDEEYDIIVYTIFISLGFAALENIFYVIDGGFSAAILRALTAIPAHMCFGVCMGYFLLLAKISLNNNEKGLYLKNSLLSIVIPVIAHGIYDLLLLSNKISLFFILIVLLILFFIYSYKKIKSISSINKSI